MTGKQNIPAAAETGAAAASGKTRTALLIGVPSLLAVLGLALYLGGGRYVETDNGYVKADKVPVSTEVAGRIASVAVRENQSVSAGQVLLQVDPAPYRVAVARAEAHLAEVRTELAALQAGYREKQAEIDLARTEYAFARKTERRQADLADRQYISGAMLDDARRNADLAGERIAMQERGLNRIAQSLGGGVDAPIERHPAYLAALAELEQARLDLRRTTVRAPVAGTVSNPPKIGQYADAGKTAMILVSGGELWVEANFTETDLTYVHSGQPATITVDTYPGTEWHGTVDSMSPATGAEFSVIPAQNASGNWVKITQRVPVRIRLDRRTGQPDLRAGLSAEVRIDTGHRRSLFGIGG